MNEDPENIPEGASQLRYMMAGAGGNTYQYCKSLSEARSVEGMVAIMQGDDGGQIYFTCPARHIQCNDETLARLLVDLDALEWGDPDSAGLYFEKASPVGGVAGGMGGGVVRDGIWLHARLEHIRPKVEAVVAGTSLGIG